MLYALGTWNALFGSCLITITVRVNSLLIRGCLINLLIESTLIGHIFVSHCCLQRVVVLGEDWVVAGHWQIVLVLHMLLIRLMR